VKIDNKTHVTLVS